MELYEAMSIFGITEQKKVDEEELKRIYRQLCFFNHPDAHLDEDFKYYNDMMSKINTAYEILKYYCACSKNKDFFTNDEEQQVKKQTEKEKILMDIIVRAYYASKPEIDKINSDFLDLFLSIPQKVGNITGRNYKPIVGYRHIEEIFISKAKTESEIMNKYIKKYAEDFAEKYGIKIEFLDVVGDEYINFLNNANWYEKYINYQEKEDIKKIK